MPPPDEPRLPVARIRERGPRAALRHELPPLVGAVLHAIIFGGVVLAPLVFARACADRTMRSCSFGCESKADIARLTIYKYAREAYPTWIGRHPERPCPSLLSLNVYMNNRDTVDPWGTHYARACATGGGAPPRILVFSAGEDGTFGTDDDLGSGWSP